MANGGFRGRWEQVGTGIAQGDEFNVPRESPLNTDSGSLNI